MLLVHGTFSIIVEVINCANHCDLLWRLCHQPFCPTCYICDPQLLGEFSRLVDSQEFIKSVSSIACISAQ
jgi:hypothetical protein